MAQGFYIFLFFQIVSFKKCDSWHKKKKKLFSTHVSCVLMCVFGSSLGIVLAHFLTGMSCFSFFFFLFSWLYLFSILWTISVLSGTAVTVDRSSEPLFLVSSFLFFFSYPFPPVQSFFLFLLPFPIIWLNYNNVFHVFLFKVRICASFRRHSSNATFRRGVVVSRWQPAAAALHPDPTWRF